MMRVMASQRTQDLIALKSVARYTVKYPRMTCRYAWTELGSNIEVSVHSGRSCDVEWAVCEGGGVPLSSVESELAAVVKAATE